MQLHISVCQQFVIKPHTRSDLHTCICFSSTCLMSFLVAVPTVTSITGSQVVTLGTDATLSCQFNGNPSPGVVWYQDEVVLRPSSKYVYSNTSSTSTTLTINNVQPAELTSYKCLSFNKRSSIVEQTFLCGQRM